jgi:hypothetical protein
MVTAANEEYASRPIGNSLADENLPVPDQKQGQNLRLGRVHEAR